MAQAVEARIEQALARIEAAAAARAFAAAKLARRHARLRERVTAAVTSLDALIAEGQATQGGDVDSSAAGGWRDAAAGQEAAD
jgi:hypothetical protein